MKLRDFVEVLDIFQGIKLIDAYTKKPTPTTQWDKFTAAKSFGDWYVYKAYTAVGGEDLIIEIDSEEI